MPCGGFDPNTAHHPSKPALQTECVPVDRQFSRPGPEDVFTIPDSFVQFDSANFYPVGRLAQAAACKAAEAGALPFAKRTSLLGT